MTATAQVLQDVLQDIDDSQEFSAIEEWPHKVEKKCRHCAGDFIDEIDYDTANLLRFRSDGPFWRSLVSREGACPNCQHIEERERQQRERAIWLADRQKERGHEWNNICPPLYRDTQEELLPRAAQERRHKVLSWTYNPKGMILTGPSGTGKTRLAWQLMHKLYVQEIRSVKVFDCMAFAHECSHRVLDGKNLDYWSREIAKHEVLFLDDLGKLKFSDRVEAELFAIIERRTAWQLPIICTTNDNGETLKSRMSEDRGEPFIRRLKEFCEIIAFT